MVIGTGRHTYTPGAALARLIRARETHCRMPGCNRQAVSCVIWTTRSHTPPNRGRRIGISDRCAAGITTSKTHHGYQLTNLLPPGEDERPHAGAGAPTDTDAATGPELTRPPGTEPEPEPERAPSLKAKPAAARWLAMDLPPASPQRPTRTTLPDDGPEGLHRRWTRRPGRRLRR